MCDITQKKHRLFLNQSEMCHLVTGTAMLQQEWRKRWLHYRGLSNCQWWFSNNRRGKDDAQPKQVQSIDFKSFHSGPVVICLKLASVGRSTCGWKIAEEMKKFELRCWIFSIFLVMNMKQYRLRILPSRPFGESVFVAIRVWIPHCSILITSWSKKKLRTLLLFTRSWAQKCLETWQEAESSKIKKWS